MELIFTISDAILVWILEFKIFKDNIIGKCIMATTYSLFVLLIGLQGFHYIRGEIVTNIKLIILLILIIGEVLNKVKRRKA